MDTSPDTLTAASYRIAPVEPAAFTTHRMAAIRHDFHEHPLMRLDALAALAHRLFATKQCRFITPGSTTSAVFAHRPRHPDGRDIDEVFRRIEEPGSWVALYNVETDPAYRGFLDEVVRAFRPLVEREQPGIASVGGFIFVSAPPSVTPFHIDRENNFWLQVRGRKAMSVWDPRDREVVAAADVDQFIVYGALENVRLEDRHLARRRVFDVGPGDGVYFPSTSPHMTRSDPGWARPGDGVSVSIGVVFYTAHTRRLARIHACNLLLRQRGLQPAHAGEGGFLVDGAKALCGRAFVWGKKTFRGWNGQVGL